MKMLLVLSLAIIVVASITPSIFGEKGTYVDKIQFIQYLDENTALEEVKKGNLDLYYFRIPSDRIESVQSREGLKVYESTGGSYSILVNPAESEKFNPFSIGEVRFALNYLVDRKLIVNELMGGFGTPMISNYGPYDPDYLSILEELESFNFRYNPSLAKEIISKNLVEHGAILDDGKWYYADSQIEVKIFIRSDDPVRKSIGEILSSELQNIGFKVTKDFGDLNKAFVVVYGSNPAELKWNLYTEGWAGRSAFVKYDSIGLGQMYSPWFSNMPGFNDPTYWNYKNPKLDSITQKIYTGNFTSSNERAELIQAATLEGVKESVRIFLASKLDQYVVNQNVNGVVNDFGAGVPSRFTPINARADSNSLVIGVKQIYQGAWNPIMGLNDAYSKQIWDNLYDPDLFKHPYTGETIPIRSSWNVHTAGPNDKLDVPDDVITWSPDSQIWIKVPSNATATSKVTFDLTFSNWHHGVPMDINDVLYSVYFTKEWGTQQGENDKTFDSEYTPRASQIVNTLVGIKPIDENTVEVFVNYWHFDDAEIADWAAVWSATPWEIIYAMENAVIDGKTSFSRSGAVSKNVNWLSLIVPNDAKLIQDYLGAYKTEKNIPKALNSFNLDENYFQSRYDASMNWISEHNHAVISNGPFYLDNYSPESRTITIKAFSDDTYPFGAGHWKKFEEIEFPKITNVQIPEIISKSEISSIPVETVNSSELLYFLTDSKGDLVSSNTIQSDSGRAVIQLSPSEIEKLTEGANNIKIFAISDSVLRPDIYTTSFLVLDEQKLPDVDSISYIKESEFEERYALLVIIPLLVGLSVFVIRRKIRQS